MATRHRLLIVPLLGVLSGVGTSAIAPIGALSIARLDRR
jgi:hypothetical protein